jgi:3-mercaptopyruvate sulfurtransferase SseA
MRTVGLTIAQALVLLLLGIAIGCGANAVRTKGHIDIGRDYFTPSTQPTHGDPGTTKPTSQPIPYEVLTLEQVVQLYEDPKCQTGEYLFVDAREDEDYNAGHIRGAIQCDHYQLDRFIDNVLQFAAVAEKVVVYCKGGDCEDSLLVCGDLEARGIPRERLSLFQGGWDEWSAKQMPSETREEQAP